MRMILAGLVCLISQTCWAEDRGYFTCFNLNDAQRTWFANPPVSGCCALTDGLPVRYEQRSDGYYVPPYPKSLFEAQQCKQGIPWQANEDHTNEDRSDWVKVAIPPLKTPNMVGVGVIWWGWSGNEEDPNSYSAKCVIFGVLV